MLRWHQRWQPLLAALALSGCGLSGKQSIVDPDGPVAKIQYETFLVTFWVALAIFAVVGGLFLYCLLKFTVRGEVSPDYPLPDQGHGNPLMEIGVIFVSILLVGIVAVPSVYGVLYSGTIPEGQKPIVINVTGYQWWWKFEYPELGVVTANECVIPVGRPVQFKVQTADVLHSFWIPRLGGKMDLTPGQDNWLWLQADKEGIYWGQCTEFCGESHAFMRMRVRAKDQAGFDQWVLDEKKDAVATTPPPAALGQCYVCHTIRGVPGAQGLVGPDLTHIGSRSSIAAGLKENSPTTLTNWILNPEYYKPGNIMNKTGYEGMNIHPSKADASAIAEYLYGLK